MFCLDQQKQGRHKILINKEEMYVLSMSVVSNFRAAAVSPESFFKQDC